MKFESLLTKGQANKAWSGLSVERKGLLVILGWTATSFRFLCAAHANRWAAKTVQQLK